MTRAEHTEILNRLAALLRKQPLTAKQIAAQTKCCVPAVYARIRALQARGVRVLQQPITEKRTGPKAVAYFSPRRLGA